MTSDTDPVTALPTPDNRPADERTEFRVPVTVIEVNF